MGIAIIDLCYFLSEMKMFLIYNGVHGYQKSFETLDEAISSKQASKLLGAPIVGNLK